MFHFQFHTYKLIFMYNCPCFSLPSFSFASISTLYTDRSVNYSIEFRTSVALKLASSFCLILFFSSQLPFLVHLARPSCWSVHPGLRACSSTSTSTPSSSLSLLSSWSLSTSTTSTDSNFEYIVFFTFFFPVSCESFSGFRNAVKLSKRKQNSNRVTLSRVHFQFLQQLACWPRSHWATLGN